MIATASRDNPRSRRRRRARRSLRVMVASASPPLTSKTSRSTKRRISGRVSPVDRASRRSRSFSDTMPNSFLPQLLGKLPDFGAERDWQTHVDLGIEVAVALTAEPRHAEATEPEPSTVLGLKGDLERHPAPPQRRHHHLAAEQGHVQGHQDPDGEVVALAAECRMRQHVDAHEEIPRSTPVAPRSTLAGDPHPGSVPDARWNPHLHPAASPGGLELHRTHGAAIRLLQSERGLRFDILAG